MGVWVLFVVTAGRAMLQVVVSVGCVVSGCWVVSLVVAGLGFVALVLVVCLEFSVLLVLIAGCRVWLLVAGVVVVGLSW